jgi:hypothetical protein
MDRAGKRSSAMSQIASTGKTYVEFANTNVQMVVLFGRFLPEKGRIFLRKHQEIRRKFGRPSKSEDT